jgi:serine phosphatase RsbU (regulator of sigma subunit)
LSARLPRAWLAGGGVLLAAGLAAAFAVLPEWRARPPRPGESVEAARKLVQAAGGRLERPRLLLEGRRLGTSFERAYRRLGADARAYLEETGGAVAWTVRGTLEIPGVGTGTGTVAFEPGGRPVAIEYVRSGSLFGTEDQASIDARRAFVARLENALVDGRARGAETHVTTSNLSVRIAPIALAPGGRAESLVVQDQGGLRFSITRQLRDPEAARAFEPDEIVRKLLVHVPGLLLVLAVAVLFGVLLFKRRLDFRIALVLTALAAVYAVAGGLSADELAAAGSFVFFVVLFRAATLVTLLALWAVAESLVRDTTPGFTTSLDSFVARRLGPRGGVSILAGLGAGAATVGIALLAFAAAALAASRGAWPTAPSFPFPLFESQKGPFFEGAYDTALFVLAVAALRFALPRRWAGPAAATLFALYLSLGTPLHPWGAALALCLAFGIVFLLIFETHGLAALLVTAVSSALIRDTLVASRFLESSLLPAILTAVPLVLIAAAGVIGTRRPASEEEGRLEAPEYVRRLESERRVKYEMDLLSRMQLSLLPEKPPVVDGLDLAVRTVLATEAGGDLFDFVIDDAGTLWIAAGDVSGHGYSCGIQQAMVMASLSSLVKAGRRPSGILVEIDRVLRMGRSGRLFTSLALLNLDPKTGTGLLANAGHPYPLLLVEGACREIAGSGLPLGQGPKRTYDDIPVELPKGGVLILASDGLYEGPDLVDTPYGYDRPRDVLTAVSLWRRPAEAIVEALFADWRRHVGDGTPADDTTILVVKRPLF